MKRVLWVFIALIPLTTLEAKTPPAPSFLDHRGLLYEQLSPQRWRIGVTGVGGFDTVEVAHRILRRAAKLTLSRGFDWFEPIGERVEPVETRDVVDPPPLLYKAAPDLKLRWGERCAAGWSFAIDPNTLCSGPDAIGDRPFQATTQVMMGHGVAPRDGRAVPARAIMKATST